MAKRPSLRRTKRKKRIVVVPLICILCTTVSWKIFDISSVMRTVVGYFSDSSAISVSGDTVRGTVYDRNYKIMAESMERVSVYTRSREVVSIDETAAALAPVLGVDEVYLHGKLESDSLRSWLVRNINQEQEDGIRELNLPGIYLHRENSRYYPLKKNAAHLLGFVQGDVGLTGVEYYYDRLLQKMLAEKELTGYTGGAGQHVLLTVDLKLQEILDKFVQNLVDERDGAKIGAYAMDAGTGALVAAIQYPSFDPNTYKIYNQEVLESLLVKPMILPPLFRRMFRDAAGLAGDYRSRASVIPWSVGKHGMNLGTELRLWENLGLASGAPDDFGNIAQDSQEGADYFLQSVAGENEYRTVPETVTPLAFMGGMSMLLNGGRTVYPHLVDTVVGASDRSEYRFRDDDKKLIFKEVVKDSVSTEFSSMVAGLGRTNDLGGVTISDSVQRGYSCKDGFGSFANEVYFTAIPAHRAELVILVTIQDPSRKVPAKKAKKIWDLAGEIETFLPRVAVLQQVGKGLSGVAEPEQGDEGNFPVTVAVKEGKTSGGFAVSSMLPFQKTRMPDLVGLSVRKSLRLLKGTPCKLSIHGTGKVVKQRPKPGKTLKGGDTCSVILQQQNDVSLEALEHKLSKNR